MQTKKVQATTFLPRKDQEGLHDVALTTGTGDWSLTASLTMSSLTGLLIAAAMVLTVTGLSVRASGRAPAKRRRPTSSAAIAPSVPWLKPLRAALNHGGTQRKNRDRSSAKRKHVQLATVDADGRPTVRTVVFRGFLPRKFVDGGSADTSVLMFITDQRSAKYQHLSSHQKVLAPVEVCWWLDEAGVQVRWLSERAACVFCRRRTVLLSNRLRSFASVVTPSSRLLRATIDSCVKLSTRYGHDSARPRDELSSGRPQAPPRPRPQKSWHKTLAAWPRTTTPAVTSTRHTSRYC